MKTIALFASAPSTRTGTLHGIIATLTGRPPHRPAAPFKPVDPGDPVQ